MLVRRRAGALIAIKRRSDGIVTACADIFRETGIFPRHRRRVARLADALRFDAPRLRIADIRGTACLRLPLDRRFWTATPIYRESVMTINRIDTLFACSVTLTGLLC
jgi:hypothetical protein